METTQLTPEAPVQPEAPERLSSASRFQLPKKRKKWLKRLVLILAAAGVLLLLLRPLLFGGPAASSGQYQPVPVQRQDLTVSVDGSGTMTPIESYQVGRWFPARSWRLPSRTATGWKRDSCSTASIQAAPPSRWSRPSWPSSRPS